MRELELPSQSPPLAQVLCHCDDCKHQTGTAFAAVVVVPREALTVEGETLASYTTVGEDHGTDTERQFCSTCGSPLVSLIEAMPEVAFIKAGTLDDSSWFEPAAEVWTRSAHVWLPELTPAARMERGPA